MNNVTFTKEQNRKTYNVKCDLAKIRIIGE